MSLPKIQLSASRYATSLMGSMHVPCIRRSGEWAYCGMDALKNQPPDFAEREWRSCKPVIWRICADCISVWERENGTTPVAPEIGGMKS